MGFPDADAIGQPRPRPADGRHRAEPRRRLRVRPADDGHRPVVDRRRFQERAAKVVLHRSIGRCRRDALHGPLHGRRNRLRVGAADCRRPGRIPRLGTGARASLSPAVVRARARSAVAEARTVDGQIPGRAGVPHALGGALAVLDRRPSTRGVFDGGRHSRGIAARLRPVGVRPSGQRQVAPGMVCNGHRRTRRVHHGQRRRRGLPRRTATGRRRLRRYARQARTRALHAGTRPRLHRRGPARIRLFHRRLVLELQGQRAGRAGDGFGGRCDERTRHQGRGSRLDIGRPNHHRLARDVRPRGCAAVPLFPQGVDGRDRRRTPAASAAPDRHRRHRRR